MYLFESSSRFGRLEPHHLGLWLNLDQAIAHERGAEVLPLLWSTFHFPVDDRHRAYVESLADPADRRFALTAFTAAVHETRHFHDLLSTPYGAVFMRQYARAAIAVLMSRLDILVRPGAILAPLRDWEANWQLLRPLEPRLGAPPEALRELAGVLDTAATKLHAFDRGITGADMPITATAILEALATNVQLRHAHLAFGDEAGGLLREQLQQSPARGRYLGVTEWLLHQLGPMPFDALQYLLWVSLCGNFQDSRPERPRYPTDVLLFLVGTLRRHGIRPGRLSGFEELRVIVDELLDDALGDDVDGLIIQGSKATDGVEQALRTGVERYEEQVGHADEDLRTALAVLKNFKEAGAAFGCTMALNAGWYSSDDYLAQIDRLPQPLVLLTSELGVPVTPELREMYYVQSSTGLRRRDMPREVLQLADRWFGGEDVLQLAHVLSPHEHTPAAAPELPSRLSFQLTPIRVGLWQRHYDAAVPLLRLLMEGRSAPLPSTVMAQLAAVFATMGTSVMTTSGALAAPDPSALAEGLALDPDASSHLSSPWFQEQLAGLRQSKRQEPAV
jgi:hypothetical protein